MVCKSPFIGQFGRKRCESGNRERLRSFFRNLHDYTTLRPYSTVHKDEEARLSPGG